MLLFCVSGLAQVFWLYESSNVGLIAVMKFAGMKALLGFARSKKEEEQISRQLKRAKMRGEGADEGCRLAQPLRKVWAGNVSKGCANLRTRPAKFLQVLSVAE
jgi:hypothetical protein